ncbi:MULTISPECIES: hypothetical protein [Pacificimonas]|uniref:Secreted protein n=1 Tax=Pacificimonas aurantium TaxID=1250540 RepID=A0ABS7WNP3_9SPHN|nr:MULTISPECIES: hypothetical protein [Pacificimonas]MBZ6380016.1 hypothetical protein [Pacificimonas aurantium]
MTKMKTAVSGAALSLTVAALAALPAKAGVAICACVGGVCVCVVIN